MDRAAGEQVASGVVNAGTGFGMRATTTAAQSTYAGIVRLAAEATSRKAPVVRLADRYAVAFVPFTLVLAGLAWGLSGDFVRAVAVLVVATPCPLLLATPIAIVAGLSRVARRGVLVRNGGALELLGQARVLLFDKTGTLTTGRPRVMGTVNAPGWRPGRAAAPGGLGGAALPARAGGRRWSPPPGNATWSWVRRPRSPRRPVAASAAGSTGAWCGSGSSSGTGRSGPSGSSTGPSWRAPPSSGSASTTPRPADPADGRPGPPRRPPDAAAAAPGGLQPAGDDHRRPAAASPTRSPRSSASTTWRRTAPRRRRWSGSAPSPRTR